MWVWHRVPCKARARPCAQPVRPLTQALLEGKPNAAETWQPCPSWSLRQTNSEGNCLKLLKLGLWITWVHLHPSGQSLRNYAQPLAPLQRTIAGIRIILTPAWKVARKWPMLEPVNHRPPIPDTMLLAMAGIGVGLGWERFVAVILVSFYCAARGGKSRCLDPSCLWMPLPTDKTAQNKKRGAKVHLQAEPSGHSQIRREGSGTADARSQDL